VIYFFLRYRLHNNSLIIAQQGLFCSCAIFPFSLIFLFFFSICFSYPMNQCNSNILCISFVRTHAEKLHTKLSEPIINWGNFDLNAVLVVCFHPFSVAEAFKAWGSLLTSRLQQLICPDRGATVIVHLPFIYKGCRQRVRLTDIRGSQREVRSTILTLEIVCKKLYYSKEVFW